MNVVERPTLANLVDRAKNILLTPKAEWEVIKAEPTDTAALYKNYILILAAIPPICQIIGLSLVGVSLPFAGTFRLPLGSALASGVAGYLLSLAAVYVIALITEALAPTFGGTKDRIRALKVVAYAMTPAWIAGVFALIPALAIIGFLVSLYGLYLVYLGLPKLMESPPEKALGYTAAVVLGAIVVMLVAGLLSGMLIDVPAPQVNMPQMNMK